MPSTRVGTPARKAVLLSRETQARNAAREREVAELNAQIASTQLLPKFASLHGAPRGILHPDQSLKTLLGAADSEEELGKPSARAACTLYRLKARPPHP